MPPKYSELRINKVWSAVKGLQHTVNIFLTLETTNCLREITFGIYLRQYHRSQREDWCKMPETKEA